MAGLGITALRFGRRSDGLTALAASVFVMTLFNPNLLLDMGLVLSASATLGVILYSHTFAQIVESWVKRLFAAESARKIVEILFDAPIVTAAAQITTLPIVFLVFGQFSIISFLVNTLVVPAQGSIMSLGILAVIAGAIWLPAGQIVAWLVGIPVAYTLAIIRAAAQLPGASVPVAPDPAIIVGYYVVLFGMTAILSQPPETRRTLLTRIRQAATTPAVAVLGLAIAAIVWATALSRPDGKLHVWFLSVGAGNAVLIQSPQGAHILVDGGENPTQLRTALGDRLPFYKRDLDLLVVTQPKPSTISALPPLFDRYNVRSAVTNGMTSTDDSYKALTDAFSSAKTQVAIATAGYHVETSDGLVLEVLSPDQIPNDPKAKPGDAPLIMRLRYKEASFLLSSDLTEKGVKTLLGSSSYLGATVLELPSNGGEKENPDELFKAVSPQIAIIEAEQGNQAAEPVKSVLNRLDAMGISDKNKKLYRTDQQGAIEIATDGSQLWVSTARQGNNAN
jgi:competence protein ComEC